MSGARVLLLRKLSLQVFHCQETNDGLHIPPSLSTNQSWQASFWNIARFDYMVSYTKGIVPTLDTGDRSLWAAAGLPLHAFEGHLQPESLRGDDGAENTWLMTETTACRSLVWLILRTFVLVTGTTNELRVMEDGRRRGDQGTYQFPTWQSIRQQLKRWLKLLPMTFKPYASFPVVDGTAAELSPSDVGSVGDACSTADHFPTLCYTSPMASMAHILYHFIQIILLLDRPFDGPLAESRSWFVSRQLVAYRQSSDEIFDHAIALCGISLDMPDNPAKIHTAQPLHLAGLFIRTPGQRFVLERLLCTLEQCTGVCSGPILTNLREEWGVAGVF